MKIQEVTTSSLEKEFLEMPLSIYKDDPQYIRPLNKDIEQVFDVAKNKALKNGSCKRWLLRNADGKKIGRIAAFINKKYRQEQPTGGIGFFECIDQQAAANLLFDEAKQWLVKEGMEAMDGPINFGERDRWWGLLVEGFYEPLYCMNYNPPYYKTLFSNYGFEVYFDQICFAMNVQDQLPEKFYQRHAQFHNNPDFVAKHIRKKELDAFAKDFTIIYNQAWAGHGGGKEMDERTVKKMFKTMKPIMDEELSWFVYHKGAPVAMWLNLPDLNQFFKHLKGKFGPLQKLNFLLRQKLGRCKRFVGIVFGVVPEFQGTGIDSYMIIEGAKVIQPRARYDFYEMQWIGDFNPKMVNIAESLGTFRSRKLQTLRYLFDRSKPFERHKMLS